MEALSTLFTLFIVALFLLSPFLAIYFIYKYFKKRRERKRGNPLIKGTFVLNEAEENKGVIGFIVAGLSHRDADDIANALVHMQVGDLIDLEPEPDNPVDENALKVVYKKWLHMGYVPAYITFIFRDSDENMKRYDCFIAGFDRGFNRNVYIKCVPV